VRVITRCQLKYFCRCPIFLMNSASYPLSHNKKRQTAMFKHSKVRQAGLIVFATTLLLILPNMTRLFG
jgi:hypothetical protein